ncbi:hypothetical protein HDU90_003717 [Geranomyces variabilis]|nr:hypothetical protein HDU90_003717 [Geranomyces variabilis]
MTSTYVFTGLSTSEALHAIETQEDQKDIRMYMDLGIPDEMLRCFDAKCPKTRLLEMPLKGKLKLWLATVYEYYHRPEGGGSDGQLTVKLSEDCGRVTLRTPKACGVLNVTLPQSTGRREKRALSGAQGRSST